MQEKYYLKMAEVKPTWLKFLILFIIGAPIITNFPISFWLIKVNTIHNIIIWLGYGCFLWIFILLNTGVSSLLKYLSVAFTLGMITILFGASVRNLIALIGGHRPDEYQYVSYKMISLFIVMISVIPYTLFFINCFSVSRFMSRISLNAEKKNKIKIHLALALRVFQHVGEVLDNLLLVWREENPLLIKPRFREEWNESKLNPVKWPIWLLNSAVIWCFALFMHTFEAIPYLAQEMSTFLNDNKNFKNE